MADAAKVDAAAAVVTTPLTIAQCRQVVDLYAQLDQANALVACLAKPEALISVNVTLRSPTYVGGALYVATTTKVNVVAAIKAEADATRVAVVKQLNALGYNV